MKKKLLIGLILGTLVLALGGGGVTYLFLTLQERSVDRDLLQARGFLDQKQWDDAQKMLDTLGEQAKGNEPWQADLFGMRLELAKGRGDAEKAAGAAKAILDPARKFKGEPVLQAHLYLAEQAMDGGDLEAAQPHWDALLKLSGDSGPGADLARLGQMRMRYAKEGPSKEIQTQLASLLETQASSPHRREVEKALGEVNLHLLFTPDPTESDGQQIYVIQKGDSLDTIAKKLKVSPEMIQRINGIKNPRYLPVGRRVVVPTVDFSIEVNKSENTLTLLNGGKFFKRYIVRTGKSDYMTPVGEYRITHKVKNPRWSDPKTGKSSPPGDPQNELGTRWMAFSGSLGIHGTIHPESIGTYASSGCVGMLTDEVEELYDLVGVGTPVKIFGKRLKQKGEKEAPDDRRKPGVVKAGAKAGGKLSTKKGGKKKPGAADPAEDDADTGGAPAVDLGGLDQGPDKDSGKSNVSVSP